MALQLRADEPQWWGLAGLIPLVNLGLGALRAALAGRSTEDAEQQAAAGADSAWHEQQQQQQFSPELLQLLQQHQAAAMFQQAEAGSRL